MLLVIQRVGYAINNAIRSKESVDDQYRSWLINLDLCDTNQTVTQFALLLFGFIVVNETRLN